MHCAAEYELILRAIRDSEQRQVKALLATEGRLRDSIAAVHVRLGEQNGRVRAAEERLARHDERIQVLRQDERAADRRSGTVGGITGGIAGGVVLAVEYLLLRLRGGP